MLARETTNRIAASTQSSLSDALPPGYCTFAASVHMSEAITFTFMLLILSVRRGRDLRVVGAR